jgi:hypothetical protein
MGCNENRAERTSGLNENGIGMKKTGKLLRVSSGQDGLGQIGNPERTEFASDRTGQKQRSETDMIA